MYLINSILVFVLNIHFIDGILSIRGLTEKASLNDDNVLEIYIKGSKKSCVIDGCALVCNGDEAFLDICVALKMSSYELDYCHMKDQCTIQCNGKTHSFCEISTNRNLGNLIDMVGEKNNIWPNGNVCYSISKVSQLSLVKNAMKHWADRTGIQFIDCSSDLAKGKCCSPCEDYINFFEGNGCWSYVGKTGGGCKSGGQPLSVGPTCSEGSVIHEIGHAIGLLHEHTRRDREDYIKVVEDNIKSGYVHNFEEQGVSKEELVGEYDYYSIMHYANTAFAIDEAEPTIIPIDSEGKPRANVAIGQRHGLSKGDVFVVRALYKQYSLPSPIVEAEEIPGFYAVSERVEVFAIVIYAIVVVSAVVTIAITAIIIYKRRKLVNGDKYVCSTDFVREPTLSPSTVDSDAVYEVPVADSV